MFDSVGVSDVCSHSLIVSFSEYNCKDMRSSQWLGHDSMLTVLVLSRPL